ncbi:hypothetical protein B0H14DRAFT_3169531 [Mycena olivaceomarginata]|nr:hypothetical protein B0H14DRAFT_3169531 [Mycena olivaceomarginata]
MPPSELRMFQWIGTEYRASNAYSKPTLVPARKNAEDLDYSPGRLPASTGRETGMIQNLFDD